MALKVGSDSPKETKPKVEQTKSSPSESKVNTAASKDQANTVAPKDQFVSDAAVRQQQAKALGNTADTAPAQATSAASGTGAATEVTPATIAAATDRAREADEAVEKLNEKLGAELAGLGDTLTPEQQEAYTAEFRERNGYDAAIAEQRAAHEELAAQLSSPELKAKMACPPDGNTYACIASEGLERLAKGPMAADAVKILGDFQNATVAGPSYQVKFGEVFKDETKRILETAAPAAFTQLSATADSPEAAAQAFKDLYAPFADRPEVQKAFELIDQVTSSADPIDAFANNVDGNTDGFGAVGFLLTAYKLGGSANKVAGGIKATDLARLTTLFESGRIPNGMAAKVAGAVGKMLKIPGAETAAARFLPAVGALFAAKNALERLAKDDKNVGDFIGLAGDLASVVGNGISATVVGAPIGVILSGAGALVSLLGDKISGDIDRGKLVDARKEILNALADQGKFDPALVDLYAERGEDLGKLVTEANVSPEDLAYLAKNWPGNLADSVDPFALKIALGNFAESEDYGAGAYGLGTVRLGLTPQQVVDLARQGYGDLFKDYTDLSTLQDAKRKFKLTGDELVQFLQAGLQDAPGGSPEEKLRFFLERAGPPIDLEFQKVVDSTDPKVWIDFLRSRGFESAAGYLENLNRPGGQD